MAKILEKTINSVQDFVDFVDKKKIEKESSGIIVDFLFRGQRRIKPLIPKLGRINLRGEIKNIEKLMLTEFERTSFPLTEFETKNKWDVIALAQHHGLPTRLLDWTYSALAALWFTVKEPPFEKKDGTCEDGVVWILIPELEDFNIDTENDNPFSNSLTKIFRPNFISRRISAQAGLFTIHKIVKGNRFIPLENHIRFKSKLIKIIVPSDLFASIRKQLHILGVNYSTEYPDIDGLCHHLSWRFSFYDDENSSMP